jgi:glycerol-3-phosphate dehydrogenase
MTRTAMLHAVEARREPWDIIVIGGGATGVGIALDAAVRNYSVLLLEEYDFGKGTSSRSTKLVHGGVRYLKSGQVRLVREALVERSRLRRNAPSLVSDLAFVVPVYNHMDLAIYGAGLKMYDLLAPDHAFGRTELLSRSETVAKLPAVRRQGLAGGILYHDGQFDDARLLIQLARTAADHGAILVNYAPVVRLDGRRVDFRDIESGTEIRVQAQIVINAAGPFSDAVRRLADPLAKPAVAASQGTHIVVGASFLGGENALMVPKTSDGRVLFAIPWLGHTLIGTTDTPVQNVPPEPQPLAHEIDFILETAKLCLQRPPRTEDVLASFAGIRPLVLKGSGGNTAALSRDHSIRIEPGGMLTIVGGKWTTYRSMAEDCVNKAAAVAGLPPRPCGTYDLPIRPLDEYPAGKPLHPDLPYTEGDVLNAVRHEMARTTEDVLARRTRASFLNARAAAEVEPHVALLMRLAKERMDARQ